MRIYKIAAVILALSLASWLLVYSVALGLEWVLNWIFGQ